MSFQQNIKDLEEIFGAGLPRALAETPEVETAPEPPAEAQSALAFNWVWRAISTDNVPEFVSVHHAGRCGRCGRKLTVPTSIESGFGPDCLGKVA